MIKGVLSHWDCKPGEHLNEIWPGWHFRGDLE